MAKNDFVNAGLYHIKDKIADAAPSEDDIEQEGNGDATQDFDPKTLESSDNKSENKNVKSPGNPGKQYQKALRQRHGELIKLKRDITTRYTENIATLTERGEYYRDTAREIEKVIDLYTSNLKDIESIDDSQWSDDNYTSKLGEALKKLENYRLELMRQNSRLAERTKSHEGTGGGATTPASFIPEMGSLSFRQIFRMGFIFSLPILLILLLGSIVVALSIFLSMRV